MSQAVRTAADALQEHFEEVPLRGQSLDRFDAVLAPAGVERLHAAVAAAVPTFGDRTVWNVNSTAKGGGVAELLVSLLPFARGAGVDARWLVVGGDGDYFRLTKRIHNRLHGALGDGGPLGDAEREVYERRLVPAGRALAQAARAGDVVILHDPQTAGMAPALKDRGLAVVWRCHVGVDVAGDIVHSAWRFLEPYVSRADACVFSRQAFAWDVLAPERTAVIRPSIDPFAPKNEELGPEHAATVLEAAGLVAGGPRRPRPAFTRPDGTTGHVRHRARVERVAPLAPRDRYVLQVSRWDDLKDPSGLVDAFARHIAPSSDAHFIYAGPEVSGVSDDPEGAQVFDRVRAEWRLLPDEVRARVHLARLPMRDPDENATMVNALQRQAAVVVQKSVAEGFGLTVTEAMWKGRPVIASALGGILEQIEHGRSGLLLADPRDGAAFGAAVLRLLGDPEEAAALGRAAHARVRDEYLSDRSLLDYLRLLAPLLGVEPPPAVR